MVKWYIKELSKLSGVPVRTLHHYDSIDLLKPSLRGANNYRLYSEEDLLRLQRIIALKFFGFNLSEIKRLLVENIGVMKHFSTQSKLLKKKAEMLLKASDTLDKVLNDCGNNKSIPWKTIITLIEVYHMTEKLEKTWAGKVLTEEELKEYANFEYKLKSAESQKDDFKKNWAKLMEKVNDNLQKDPSGEFGIEIGKQAMDLVNPLYGREDALLKKAIWDKGFKGGYFDKESGVSSEVVAWLDKAMSAYYRSRIYITLDQVGSGSKEAPRLWEALLDEMYGGEQELKDNLVDIAMKDDKVSLAAKRWLTDKYGL